MSTLTPISIHIEKKLFDYVNASRVYLPHSPTRTVECGLAIFFLMFGLLAFLSLGMQWGTFLLLSCAFTLWFGTGVLRGLFRWMQLKLHPELAGPLNITFDETGVYLKSQKAESRLNWSSYDRVIEGDHVILLVFGRWLYTTIPKRAFKDDAQLNAFLELARKSGK